jgi:hypothetical protein
VRDVPLREDSHRCREDNGVQILATLRSLVINALGLDGIWSITEEIAALAQDIRAGSGCWTGDPRRRRPQDELQQAMASTFLARSPRQADH